MLQWENMNASRRVKLQQFDKDVRLVASNAYSRAKLCPPRCYIMSHWNDFALCHRAHHLFLALDPPPAPIPSMYLMCCSQISLYTCLMIGDPWNSELQVKSLVPPVCLSCKALPFALSTVPGSVDLLLSWTIDSCFCSRALFLPHQLWNGTTEAPNTCLLP